MAGMARAGKLFVVAAVLLMALSGAASAYQLGKGAARSAAESKAYDYVRVRSFLDSSDTRKCNRKAARRVVCIALAGGATKTKETSCRLLISVRAVHRLYYWDAVAKIQRARCRTQRIPRLTYGDARAAFQEEADRVAGQPTTLDWVFRTDEVTYSGSAEWERTDPTGCHGCGYNPTTEEAFDTPTTESCHLGMKATLTKAEGIKVEIESSSCY